MPREQDSREKLVAELVSLRTRVLQLEAGRALRRIMTGHAQRHQPHARLDMPPGMPKVLADEGKLAQIAINLLSNAIKYGPDGGQVTISAHREEGGSRIVFSVADQGIGIAEENRDRLFATFQRIQRKETQRVRGTSLGLYIVKGLLELMGGSI